MSVHDFFRGGWQISEADRQYLEAEYDDYNATNASGAAFCRSAVLIVSPQNHILHTNFLS